MKKRTASFGVGISVLSIVLFYIAYDHVFFVNLFSKNIAGLLTWSVFSGLVVVFYHYLNKKIALLIFLIGYVVAFGSLFYTFTNSSNTFDSITGSLRFIFILAGGFAVSLVNEAVLYLLDKKRRA